ncbi:helix-turn-helix transcriptional regulator [Angustibacter sp. McL0619]|uniref:helix-turn-helix transcriptional regulator n=1 Tax=Angustibacter sp. McL0619 TaxID=3415676 RepID=UPI003CE6EDDB
MATHGPVQAGPPFVGRERQLAELRDRMTGALDGHGGLVLVSGPAGIGKTRLVEQACVTPAGPASAPVRWGRAVDEPGAPPLWPWRTALAALATAPAEPVGDAESARFRFVADSTDALVRAAEPDGLVVVLEDLHWADETSLRLLRRLAGEVAGSRLLIVATHRDGAAGPLADALPDLLRWSTTHPVPLPPLVEHEVRAYLSQSLHRPAEAEQVRSVLHRCGGNPLYLRAVTDLVRAGSAEPLDGDVGSQLRSLVRAVLSGLPPGVCDLVDAAAVLGEQVDVGALAAVSGRPEGDVQHDLDTAVRVGVLAEVPDGGPGRLRFVHAVVREGVYADLDRSHREALHRRAALGLQEQAGHDPARAGLVAGHWLRCARDPADLRTAADWAVRAADAATRAFADAEAVRYLEMALGELARAGGDDGERAELTLQLAEAQFRAGRVREASDCADQVVDLSLAAGRGDLLAPAALVVHDVAAPEVLPQVELRCARVLELRPDLDVVTRARLLALRTSAAADAGRPQDGREWSRQALELAERSGDDTALVEAARARDKVVEGAFTPPERLRLGRVAVETGTRSGQPMTVLWGLKWRIDAALHLGQMATADAEIAALGQLARSSRLPLVRWHELRVRASVTALRGEFAEALELNAQAARLGARELSQDISAVGMSEAFLLVHSVATGQPVLSEESLATMRSAPQELIVVRVSVALMLLQLGRTDEARAAYDGLGLSIEDVGPELRHGVPLSQVALVSAFGDVVAAAALEPLVARYEWAVGDAGVYCFGSARWFAGRLALVQEHWDDAVSHFESALRTDTRTGARPAVARDRVGLAESLLGRSRTDHAHGDDLPRALQEAVAAAREARALDMPDPLRQAVRLQELARAAQQQRDPLSGREREVAELVSQGLSNRQIAQRLVLSERTVESHMRSILAKLGVANRVQLVSALAVRPD